MRKALGAGEWSQVTRGQSVVSPVSVVRRLLSSVTPAQSAPISNDIRSCSPSQPSGDVLPQHCLMHPAGLPSPAHSHGHQGLLRTTSFTADPLLHKFQSSQPVLTPGRVQCRQFGRGRSTTHTELDARFTQPNTIHFEGAPPHTLRSRAARTDCRPPGPPAAAAAAAEPLRAVAAAVRNPVTS